MRAGSKGVHSDTEYVEKEGDMISKRCLLAMFVVLSCVMFFTTGPAFSTSTPPIVDYSSVATQTNCEALKGYVAGLTDVTFNKPVTNVTATWKTASSGATFCQVTGWIWPETKFQVTMPTLWNERYQMNGGGGWDGSLSVPASPNADRLRHVLSERWLHGVKLGAEQLRLIRAGRTVLQPVLRCTRRYPTGSGGYYGYYESDRLRQPSRLSEGR